MSLEQLPTLVGAQVFVISREKIQKRGYETLFKYMTVNNARTTIGRSVLSAPKRWQVRGVVECDSQNAKRPTYCSLQGPLICAERPLVVFIKKASVSGMSRAANWSQSSP